MAGIALGFLALLLWVSGLPVPGLDVWVGLSLLAGTGLSVQALRAKKRIGVAGLAVNGLGLILYGVLLLT